MSITTNQFQSTNIYGGFKVLDDGGILGTGVGAVPASFDISGNGIFRGSNIEFTNLPVSSATPTSGTQLITKTYADATYTGTGLLSTNNTWTGTNAFNTSLPTSTVTPTSGTDLITKTYADANYTGSGILSSSNTFTGATNTFQKIVATKLNELVIKTDNLDNIYTSTAFPTTITTGSFNNAFGSNVITAVTTGNGNQAFGADNLNVVTTGDNNTVFGVNNLDILTSGGNNHFHGSNNGRLLTTGGSNIVFGSSNMINGTTADTNNAFGSSIMQNITSGTQNSCIGYDILNDLTTGTYNVGVGTVVGGGITTGSYNTFIGNETSALGNYSYSTALGAGAVATASNQIMLGSASDTVKCPNNIEIVGDLTITGTASGIDKTMVGLANVDNTSDANKPVSTATNTALALKANLASPTFTGTVSGIDKTMVGLANVDNTSDANKPVSTATNTALALKANLASPTFTGTVSGIDKTMVGLANVDNTSDANKPVSTATSTALDLKATLASSNTFTNTNTFTSSIKQPFVSPNQRPFSTNPSIAETIDRSHAFTNLGSISAGNAYFASIYLVAGMVITGVSSYTTGSTFGSPTRSAYYCLWTNTGTLLRNVAMTPPTSVSRVATAFSSSYTVPTTGNYFVGITFAGTSTYQLLCPTLGGFPVPLNEVNGGTSLSTASAGFAGSGSTPTTIPSAITQLVTVPYFAVF